MTISPLRLFLAVIAFFFWLSLSGALLRGFAPALVSSRDTAMVILGFAIPPIWLAASAAVAWYLLTKRRTAATSKE
ncbi:hypothetical protein [Pseudomonas oryzihabitans]|uniref:hypothetical protein n=1 Tax=Pseudomonas oryzihabitans TaxID=47885 RepID=UPI0011A454EA|nr:hypothetical protein [Pseudomonas psychrotolerans]